jgi:hypothetical protein
MIKFNEIADPSERASKVNYVNELWANWRETRQQTLKRITNYLFVLNTGALLAALTYVATKQANSYIHVSIWLFSAGTLLIVLHATLDYYASENGFTSYRKNVEELFGNKIEWAVFVDRNEKRGSYDWLLHTLGWLSALLFFVGLVVGISQV